MTMTKIYDLAYEIDGENINLEQDAGCGEVDRIQLHKIHVRLIAEQLGVIAEQREHELSLLTQERIKEELKDLRDGMQWLVDFLASIGHFPPQPDESEEVVQARWVLSKIDRICDLAGLELEFEESELAQQSTTKSQDRQPSQPMLV